MKTKYLITNAIFFLLTALIITSCSPTKSQENSEERNDHAQEATSTGHHDPETETTHKHDHGDTGHEGSSGCSKTWFPKGDGVELIRSDFHFIAGNMDNINPTVIAGDGGKNWLEIMADGTPAAFVFHNKYGNVGLAATVRKLDFQGTLKLIHHAHNTADYEFVAITDNNMKLGRVEAGQEKIFDEDAYTAQQDWLTLKVSAAGTHFKGYIGDKTITHGHGDQMEDGFVGIMVEGIGKIQIKSIEIIPLEAE